MSHRLSVAPNGQHPQLGTSWYLRLYNRTGKLLWKQPVPSNTWAVNLSAGGHWAVAAIGDGTVRWFDLADQGRERLVGWHLNRGADLAGELAKYLDAEVTRITRKRWGYTRQPMWELHGQSFPIGLVR